MHRTLLALPTPPRNPALRPFTQANPLLLPCLLAATLLLLLLPGSISAAEPGKGIGDGNDGNRSGPVHLISLLDDTGSPIKATDAQPRPVSMRQTCGACHNYDTIATGWHFHSGSTNPPSGRAGEPWVLSDTATRTQIPVSNRGWKGTYKPSDIALTPWKFLKQFGSHFPGGDYGEMTPDDDDPHADPAEVLRWPISGTFEINCLACHNADRRHDQSEAALQAARQNYRWVPTAASGLATVSGVAFELDDFYDPATEYEIKTDYDKTRFNPDNKVFFDIVRQPPANRCYFCHSTQEQSKPHSQEWTRDVDIHMASGMTCADCHRNGVDHMITRGDEELSHGPGHASTLSCRGCHMGDESADSPEARFSGRLSAPYPSHAGIPPVHFEALSCTACHSGPFPGGAASIVRTARIHKSGLHGKHTVDIRLPHVYSPVFAKAENGQITPHNFFWPSFWGTLSNNIVLPIGPDPMKELASDALGLDGEDKRINDWRPLTEEQIATVLTLIAGEQQEPGEGHSKPQPVYVAGGRIYQLEDGEVTSAPHEAAEPYAWPIGHDVRPASQSLGANGRCTDCHGTEAAFLFGKVSVDSPVLNAEGEPATELREMIEFEQIDPSFNRAFSFSFLFRPWMKLIVILSCAILTTVVLWFAVSCVGALAEATEKQD